MVVKNKQSSIENILSNNITAVISRDNPKDIFDIYMISQHFSFNWEKILDASHKKAGFEDADLIIRLISFPIELFDAIVQTDDSCLNNFTKEFPRVIEDIKEKKNNHIS